MVKIREHILRAALSLVACLVLFGLVPAVQRLFDSGQDIVHAGKARSVVMMRVTERRRDRKQAQRRVNRTVRARVVSGAGRATELRFTPDLSLGDGEGVAVDQSAPEMMVFEEGQTDEPVVPLSQRMPTYPPRAKEEGIEGGVQVELIIDREGKVSDVSFVRLPHVVFRRPVLEAVRRWRFKPAKHKGVPVSVRRRVPIEFTLGE